MDRKVRIGFFPYGTKQENPYQNLLILAIEDENFEVVKIPGRKFFPILQIKKQQVDILHMFWPHDMYTGKNILTTAMKRLMFLLSLPVITEIPTVYSAENIVSHNARSEEEEMKWIGRLVKRCRAIICMSRAAVKKFSQHYDVNKKTLAVIPHISYTGIYKNTVTTEEAREYLQIERDAKVFLSIGRIEPYKGITEIAEAFASVNHGNAVLVIAGRCSDAEYMHALNILVKNSRNRIIVHNKYIQDAELQYYYNAADAVVFNYKDTPLNPGSIIMAMGFGAFIIAPDSEVIKETVETGDLIVFDQSEKSGLQSSLETFIKKDMDNGERKRSAEKFSAEHDPSIIGRKLRDLYYSILKQ